MMVLVVVNATLVRKPDVVTSPSPMDRRNANGMERHRSVPVVVSRDKSSDQETGPVMALSVSLVQKHTVVTNSLLIKPFSFVF